MVLRFPEIGTDLGTWLFIRKIPGDGCRYNILIVSPRICFATDVSSAITHRAGNGEYTFGILRHV